MMMKNDKKIYEIPAVRVVDTRLELNFLQSGGGNIDPGADDPWGEY
jgi:hypothetical protein